MPSGPSYPQASSDKPRGNFTASLGQASITSRPKQPNNQGGRPLSRSITIKLAARSHSSVTASHRASSLFSSTPLISGLVQLVGLLGFSVFPQTFFFRRLTHPLCWCCCSLSPASVINAPTVRPATATPPFHLPSDRPCLVYPSSRGILLLLPDGKHVEWAGIKKAWPALFLRLSRLLPLLPSFALFSPSKLVLDSDPDSSSSQQLRQPRLTRFTSLISTAIHITSKPSLISHHSQAHATPLKKINFLPTNKTTTTVKMPSRQLAAPIPISPKLRTQPDLLTTLNASLLSSTNNTIERRPSTPRQDDYSVPAPPPPSPVSFRSEAWPSSIRC